MRALLAPLMPAKPVSAAPLMERAGRAFDQLFAGSVSPWAYAFIRVGTALIFLIRHSDWLGRWVYLEHHRTVHGLAYLDASPAPPALVSPIVAGLVLDEPTTHALVYARTALAFGLLFGVRPRVCAGLLAATSYLLLAADRYRYFHHLHLLYVTLAWLSLAPIADRLNLERALMRAFRRLRGLARVAPAARDSAAWPLMLLRALALSVYLAAGVSKLDRGWLRGDALVQLERFHILKGPLWAHIVGVLGYAGVAILSCATEFALLPLLAFARTRRWGIGVALGFHLGIGASMPVYSFGAQMAVLLIAFLAETRARPPTA